MASPPAGRPSSSSKSCTTRKSKEPENGVEGRRNRRMMASIQSALLNGAPKPKNNNRKVLRKPSKDDLAFEDIANALERIKMADTDMSVSLADVRPYLLKNVDSFTDEEMDNLCEVFCESAALQTNSYYIVGLCGDLIGNTTFQDKMSENLRKMVTDFLSDNPERKEEQEVKNTSAFKALPEFLGQLAMNRWPRPYHRALEDSNMILFAVVNTVLGWINFIEEMANSDNDEIDPGKLNLLVKCAEGLYTFCQTGQRSIWLNFPDIFDGVYSSTKALLTSNIGLKRSFKSALLNLHLSLNKWSMSNVPKCTTVATQTISPFS
ncbi:hypothetical protein DdX_01611 [Ditylenchus destructor]|uniref:DUF7627 domain-containing protein n=1 Tax=Ditylenchus destructor TaxID=166010 RepID=A0AAD4NLX2_9BILA|nr:hypothetical protein DdX_01611 [Ditylenchus destructor]